MTIKLLQLAFLLAAVALFQAHTCLAAADNSEKIALDNPFGVDEWTASHFSKYLKDDANLEVSADLIEAFGLSGALLEVALEDGALDWSKLGLNAVQVVVARKSLQKLMRRMNAKPVDFWEWRAANRRLFDMWISPLLSSPRALLIWMRYYDSNEAIGETYARVFFRAMLSLSLRACFGS